MDTPKPIGKAIVQLLIKRPENLDVLYEQSFRFKDIQPNSYLNDIRIAPDDLEMLPDNEELIICTTLIWKSKSGKNLGTRKNQLITLINDYMLDRIGSKVESFTLSDPQQHRDYWHKIWEGSSNHGRWEIQFNAKYLVTLDPYQKVNSRGETRKKRTYDSQKESQEEEYYRKVSEKLKSGMVYSLPALNRLLGQISEHPYSAQNS